MSPQSQRPIRRIGKHLPKPVKDALRPFARTFGLAAPPKPKPVEPTPAVSEPDPRSLDEIGTDTGTDKSSKTHGYLPIYDDVFKELRTHEFEMVEIGVHKGASTYMWEKYFHRAHITGIDRSAACRLLATDRIDIVIADQTDEPKLRDIAQQIRPLIVVDDGSHIWSHQILAFQIFFPMIREGGYFVVEDVHTSFGERYAQTYGEPDTETAYDYVARIVRGVVAGELAEASDDPFVAYCRQWIESALFLRHAIIVKKRKNPVSHLYTPISVAEVANNVTARDMGRSYDRIEAQIVQASEEIAEAFALLTSQTPVDVPIAHSGDVTDIVVQGSGLALTADDRLLDETLNCARNVVRSSRLYRPFQPGGWVNESSTEPMRSAVPFAGKRHVLMKQTWDSNYGHWLIDCFPKLSLLDDFDDFGNCIFVTNEQTAPEMRQVVVDCFALVGVTPDQILFMDGDATYFQSLTVLGNLSDHPVKKAPGAISYLHEIGNRTATPGGPERIYLSRERSTRRRITNERAITDLLERHGFTTVYCEELTLQQQISVFHGATHVVGNMGAAMSNLVFSPPEVGVLALATPQMQHDFFYDIVCIKGGRYRGLQGSTLDPEPTLASDFSVDVDALEESMDWLMRT